MAACIHSKSGPKLACKHSAGFSACLLFRPEEQHHTRKPAHPLFTPSVLWQVNLQPDPEGPENPHGVGFSVKETVLASELQARRRVNSETSRIWKIKNLRSTNSVTGTVTLSHCFKMEATPMHAKAIGCC